MRRDKIIAPRLAGGGFAFVGDDNPFRRLSGPRIAFDKPNEGGGGSGDGADGADGDEGQGQDDGNGGHGLMARFQNNAKAGDGGGAEGDDGAGSGADEGSGGDGDGGDGDGSAFALPADLSIPDDLKGDNDLETIKNLTTKYDDISKRYASLRDRKGDKPDTADAYQLELSEDEAARVGMQDDDPVLALIREQAFEHGLTEDQFKGVFGGFLKGIAESGLIEGDGFVAPGEWEKEQFEKMGGQEQAMIKVGVVDQWLQGLKNQGVIDDAEMDELYQTANSAAGVEVLLKLRERAGEDAIPVGHATGATTMTEEEWEKMVADPRFETDPAFNEKVTKLGEQLYGRQ